MTTDFGVLTWQHFL